MTKLNEDAIEMMAGAALEKLAHRYFYGPYIAPDGENTQRSSLEDANRPDANYSLQ